MEDNAGAFYISGGMVKPAENPEIVDASKNKVVYEVIRVIDGVPLFFRDHFARMGDSFKSIGEGLKVPEEELRNGIKTLLKANGLACCNVKLTVYQEQEAQRYMMYISKSYYPGAEEVSNGVPVGLIRLERPNPNAKIINQSYKTAVADAINKGGFFEVLLVKWDEGITEGSKSNVFFFKEGKFFTAPDSEVLKGVTRKYVMQACRTAGFEVVEAMVRADELARVEGLFLSGTSIKVLPISKIDGRGFASASHPAIVSVRDEFDLLVKKHIEGNVNIW